MTSIASLSLPVLVAAVINFIVSSVIHMMSPWHKSDYPPMPDEDRVLAALRPFALPPGDYMAPRPASRADLNSPEFLAKRNAGPVLVMTVMPNGPFAMGKLMTAWFVYLFVVAAIAACVAATALPPGADDHAIFHLVGITAFMGYAAALWQMSIWYHRSLSTTIKATVDGLIYAVITGLVLAWMWPGH